MKILLATDGSPYSDAAVQEISRRPWPQNSHVKILTVDGPCDTTFPSRGSTTLYDELVKEQRLEATRRLNDAVAVFNQNAPGLLVTPVLQVGSPKEAILDEAERWGADLIVVGSHGYGAIQRLFLGSVSLAVATNALCSVEIVRMPPHVRNLSDADSTCASG